MQDGAIVAAAFAAVVAHAAALAAGGEAAAAAAAPTAPQLAIVEACRAGGANGNAVMAAAFAAVAAHEAAPAAGDADAAAAAQPTAAQAAIFEAYRAGGVKGAASRVAAIAAANEAAQRIAAQQALVAANLAAAIGGSGVSERAEGLMRTLLAAPHQRMIASVLGVSGSVAKKVNRMNAHLSVRNSPHGMRLLSVRGGNPVIEAVPMAEAGVRDLNTALCDAMLEIVKAEPGQNMAIPAVFGKLAEQGFVPPVTTPMQCSNLPKRFKKITEDHQFEDGSLVLVAGSGGRTATVRYEM